MSVWDQLSQGTGTVDMVGSFDRGMKLGDSIASTYNSGRAQGDLIDANNANNGLGDPQAILKAKQQMQYLDPARSSAVSNAGNNQTIALGNQIDTGIKHDYLVAQQALQQIAAGAPPEQVNDLFNRERDNLQLAGIDPAHINQLIEMNAQGQDITPILQAHLANGSASNSKQNEAYGQLYSAENTAGEPVQFQLSKNGQPMFLGGGQQELNPSTVMPITYDPNLNQQRSFGTESGTQNAQLNYVAPKEAQASISKRQSEDIDLGLDAADRLPELKRINTLLDTTKTGGVDKLRLYAKQSLGIESGDEAELSASLGKAVVKQYRETFGAAFTENEGNKLDRIEAGFGKSVEGNKRLVTQLQSMLERKVRKAERAAEARGDVDALEQLKIAQETEITTPEGKPATGSANVTPLTRKVMTQNEFDRAAKDDFGGNIEKAKAALTQHGYTIK